MGETVSFQIALIKGGNWQEYDHAMFCTDKDGSICAAVGGTTVLWAHVGYQYRMIVFDGTQEPQQQQQQQGMQIPARLQSRPPTPSSSRHNSPGRRASAAPDQTALHELQQQIRHLSQAQPDQTVLHELQQQIRHLSQAQAAAANAQHETQGAMGEILRQLRALSQSHSHSRSPSPPPSAPAATASSSVESPARPLAVPLAQRPRRNTSPRGHQHRQDHEDPCGVGVGIPSQKGGA